MLRWRLARVARAGGFSDCDRQSSDSSRGCRRSTVRTAYYAHLPRTCRWRWLHHKWARNQSAMLEVYLTRSFFDKMRKSETSYAKVSYRTCFWLVYNSTHNALQAYVLRKFTTVHCCNTVYLQHGGVVVCSVHRRRHGSILISLTSGAMRHMCWSPRWFVRQTTAAATLNIGYSRRV